MKGAIEMINVLAQMMFDATRIQPVDKRRTVRPDRLKAPRQRFWI